MTSKELTRQATGSELPGFGKKIAQYYFPATVAECVEILARFEGKASIIAGGTDLFLWVKEGKASPAVLVDVSRVGALRVFSDETDRVVLGPALTHAEIASNPVVKALFPALSDGCRNVGSPQIRNIGTLGGKRASAQPAADSVVPLVALDAKCEIAGPSGLRIEPLEGLSLGVGKSRVDPTREVITKIIVMKPKAKFANAYSRIAPREAMALPVINAAVQITVEEDRISGARIVTAPVAVTPFRAKKAEEFLLGKQPGNKGDLKKAAELAEREAKPRDSLVRGSGGYRKVLVGDLVEQALIQAAGKLG